MSTNEKQYYIYVRSLKERIPVTKEEFDNYYRGINAYRQKEQYHKRCVCPKAKFRSILYYKRCTVVVRHLFQQHHYSLGDIADPHAGGL